jgi:hypothetical protein
LGLVVDANVWSQPANTPVYSISWLPHTPRSDALALAAHPVAAWYIATGELTVIAWGEPSCPKRFDPRPYRMGGPPRSMSDTRNIVWSEPAANPMTTRPEGRPHETHTGAVRGLEKPKFWGPRFPCGAEFGSG